MGVPNPPPCFPKPSDFLDNGTGAIVIEYVHLRDPANGSYAYGVVLALIPNNEYHPFAIWITCAWDDDQHRWITSSGDYYETLPPAVEALEPFRGRYDEHVAYLKAMEQKRTTEEVVQTIKTSEEKRAEEREQLGEEV